MSVKKQRHYTAPPPGGANYRTCAEAMTKMGHPMNHGSARNHVLRGMRKFVKERAGRESVDISDERMWEIIKDPELQEAIGDIIGEELGSKPR